MSYTDIQQQTMGCGVRKKRTRCDTRGLGRSSDQYETRTRPRGHVDTTSTPGTPDPRRDDGVDNDHHRAHAKGNRAGCGSLSKSTHASTTNDQLCQNESVGRSRSSHITRSESCYTRDRKRQNARCSGDELEGGDINDGDRVRKQPPRTASGIDTTAWPSTEQGGQRGPDGYSISTPTSDLGIDALIDPDHTPEEVGSAHEQAGITDSYRDRPQQAASNYRRPIVESELESIQAGYKDAVSPGLSESDSFTRELRFEIARDAEGRLGLNACHSGDSDQDTDDSEFRLNHAADGMGFDMDDFDQMLEDLMGPEGIDFPEDEPFPFEELGKLFSGRSELSLQDLSTFAWTDIVLRYKITKEAESALRHFNSVTGDKNGTKLVPSEIRTARTRLVNLTGLNYEPHGRCIRNCMAFRDDDTTTDKCLECGEQRFTVSRGGNMINRAVYWTIPITPRLVAWYSDAYRAELLQTYPQQATKSVEDHMYVDFWSGLLYNMLKKKVCFSATPLCSIVRSPLGIY